MLAVAQPRIGPERAQQRVVEHVLGVLARQPPGVREQLGAVGVEQGGEGRQGCGHREHPPLERPGGAVM